MGRIQPNLAPAKFLAGFAGCHRQTRATAVCSKTNELTKGQSNEGRLKCQHFGVFIILISVITTVLEVDYTFYISLKYGR